MSQSTRLIQGTTLGPYDAEVLEAIQTKFDEARGRTDITFLLGVRNSEGVVYREVQINSLNQFAVAANRLRKLGFTEEMDKNGGMVDGFDATYRRNNCKTPAVPPLFESSK